ncbi:hypothetical protein POVWA1_077960 [Plasmodium ovale wallikeri]|uniref:Uncharacterized protein n=1 Tax=Plasmodium ovale wallikeri TaxID=864142 RepID=A0A1A9AJB3_PLAOA|nr:hypothetical protein POVWA1_077960 [Plasmodium ovale wallikeri]
MAHAYRLFQENFPPPIYCHSNGRKNSPLPRLGITAYKLWHAARGCFFLLPPSPKQGRCGKCAMANCRDQRHNVSLVHLRGASASSHSIISYSPFGMPFCVEGFMKGRIYAAIRLAILPLPFSGFRPSLLCTLYITAPFN